jgi:hypothetical protein
MGDHRVLGPGGKPIDPKVAARLSKNPNLMLGHLAGKGGLGKAPRMQIDIAITDESVKAAEKVIQGLREQAESVRKLFDELIAKGAEVKATLEAMRDAVHSQDSSGLA